MADQIEDGRPASLHAEVVILGGCLVDEQALHDATELLESSDFALESHRRIFTCIFELAEAGIPVDYTTVLEVLRSKKQLDSIGGMGYLLGLSEGLPRKLNISTYVKIVKDKAILRAIISTCELASTRAIDQSENGAVILEDMETTVLELTQTYNQQAFATLLDSVNEAGGFDDYVSKMCDPLAMTGLSTGFVDVDNVLGGLQDSELIIIAARPSMGKTAWALNIASNVVLSDLKKVVAVFSLEMSKESLHRRMLASLAEVNGRRAQAGHISVEERRKISRALMSLADRKLMIDDSANISTTQMRAKCRRLKQREGQLDLIVVDYIQLMNGGKKENRQQEVSSISRGLKALAKEMKVPVVALSQLSRASEQRGGEKRPLLSDLRESGCLSSSSTKLFLSNGVLYNSISRMNTYSLNMSGSLTPRVSKNIPNGTKKMVRMALKSGRYIDCTPDHPVFTDRGFMPAKDLTREHAIAAVRKISEPVGVSHVPEAKWIGWMLGNGSMIGYSSPSFICSCEVVAKDFCDTTKMLFGLMPRPHAHWSKAVFQYDITAGPVRTAAGNPVKNWLREHDLWGRRSPEKRIPDWFMEMADNQSIAEMIAGLWETDGTITGRTVKFGTTSNEMAWQIVWMMARLGIFCYIGLGYMSAKATVPIFTIEVADWRDVDLFRKTIPMVGRKAKMLHALKPPSKPGSNHGDRLGVWVQDEIRGAIKASPLAKAQIGYRPQGKRISQHDLSKLVEKMPELKHLSKLISPFIFWDRLKSLDEVPAGEVFDRHVVNGPHNFVANGIIVHNSLEQDADVVAFIHRPEYYSPDDADVKGLAEILIAKARNGPTGKVMLAYHSDITRFSNLQRGH